MNAAQTTAADKLDTATRAETAFSGFADMLNSCENHGYCPTISCETEAARLIADELETRGHRVHRRNLPGNKIRRVKLTPAQWEIMVDVIDTREPGHDFEAFNLRKTYIEGTSDLLDDIATFVDPDDLAMLAECGSMKAQTDAELTFIWRSAYASALMLRGKLEGKPTTITIARREAAHLRF
jgi:hypothetical protein